MLADLGWLASASKRLLPADTCRFGVEFEVTGCDVVARLSFAWLRSAATKDQIAAIFTASGIRLVMVSEVDALEHPSLLPRPAADDTVA
jgi:hypothetical protein